MNGNLTVRLSWIVFSEDKRILEKYRKKKIVKIQSGKLPVFLFFIETDSYI